MATLRDIETSIVLAVRFLRHHDTVLDGLDSATLYRFDALFTTIKATLAE